MCKEHTKVNPPLGGEIRRLFAPEAYDEAKDSDAKDCDRHQIKLIKNIQSKSTRIGCKGREGRV